MSGEAGDRNSRPVLVGVDGSPGSDAAIEFAAWEAGRLGVPLVLVVGFGEPHAFGRYGWIPGAPAVISALRDATRSALTALEQRVRSQHPEVTVRSSMHDGSGAGVLIELSATAKLVVTGSRGSGGFAGLMLGSVSAAVAAHAHTPVIVVRPSGGKPPGLGSTRLPPSGPVVVGVDGSPVSLSALEFGLNEAQARDAPLKVIFVWPGLDGEVSALISDERRTQVEADRTVNGIVGAVVDRSSGVDVSCEAVNSIDPSAPLVEASEAAGLVVVGSRSRGGIASLLLGSVSRTVLALADCPVAVIRQ